MLQNVLKQSVLASFLNFGQFDQNQRVFLFLVNVG